MKQDTNENRLIVALDGVDKEKALSICALLHDRVKIFKVGLQLYLNSGSEIIEAVQVLGCQIFLDLKLCDIPYQTGVAAAEIARMHIKMFTVHTMGGLEMMKQTVQAVQEVSGGSAKRPLVLGVTVLTSWTQEDLHRIGVNRRLEDQVVELATLAKEAGLDGVVASPREIGRLRSALGEDFLIVTPGIRPAGSAKGDQKRICTPKEAADAGANFIVVGRPILSAPDPLAAASQILDEIG